MKFVDLFAGLGGFHLALRKLGHECVFASEIDETLRATYTQNFGITPHGDIRHVRARDIPDHDILCAGFPCQPFSKAGAQDGFDDPEFGQLYKQILRIVRLRKPRYVILENVPNFQSHDEGKTWEHLKRLLEQEKYHVDIHPLSPHHFGIPQIRARVYIVASRTPLDDFIWPAPAPLGTSVSIRSILDENPEDARPLSDQVMRCLTVWQQFLRRMPKGEKIPHPLWSMEFGATYPYEKATPHALSAETLREFRGTHGCSLKSASSKQDVLSLLPSHARTRQAKFPTWKINFIKRNRDFYARNKNWLDDWLPMIKEFPSSFQKLEWNCQGETDRRLSQYVIQIRASGVRVKRPTTAPSLVAMTATQVPVITWERRYMTPTECKKLQSMEELKFLPPSSAKSYEALGNAINVEVARRVAEALIGNAARPKNAAVVSHSHFAAPNSAQRFVDARRRA